MRARCAVLLALLAVPAVAIGQVCNPFTDCSRGASGGGGEGTGTVTSIDATGPADFFTWTGGPITDTGTLTAALAAQSANVCLAGPVSGGSAVPSFRALVDADVPNTITVNLAATATALAANGGNCSAASFPLGVDASGAVESCSTSISGNAATATALAANGGNCSSGAAAAGVDASGAAETCTTYAQVAGDLGNTGASPQVTSTHLSAALPAAQGGLGQTSATDDTVPVFNGTSADLKALGNCIDTGGQHLNYTAATNAFSCGTSGDGAGDGNPAGSGSEINARSSGTTFQAVTGSSTANGGIALANQSAAAVPFSITGAASQSGHLLDITSSGGSAGDILNITRAGSTSQMIVPANSCSAPFFSFAGATNYGMAYVAGASILCAGGSRTFVVFGNGARLGSGGVYGWSDSALDAASSGSRTGISELAAGITAVGTGTQGSRAGWMQWAGQAQLAANGTNATATLATTGLSMTLTSGRKYNFECYIEVANSVAGEGAQIDFNGGTATATDFWARVDITDTALLKSQRTTALATAVSVATATGDTEIQVHGSFEASGTGTFIPRYAENAHVTGTITIYRGSHCRAWDSPP